MKYLVTGGAGFIGSNIVEELVKKGEEVIVIDNLFSGKLENIEHLIDKIKFVEGDIRYYDFFSNEFKDIDYILHQAALRSVPNSMKNPEQYHDVNINGLRNMLELARRINVKAFVFASSSSATGNVKTLPVKETVYPNPISPYAITKLVGERYCKMYAELYGLNTISLRYFNVFGPRQSLENKYAVVIPKFINCILNDEQPPIFGDGTQTRDFTYVNNIVEANLLACKVKNVSGEIFNIANGERTSVSSIVEEINKILGKDIKPKFLEKRLGDMLHTYADNKKAKNILNYKGKISFNDGLEKTIKWWKNESNL